MTEDDFSVIHYSPLRDPQTSDNVHWVPPSSSPSGGYIYVQENPSLGYVPNSTTDAALEKLVWAASLLSETDKETANLVTEFIKELGVEDEGSFLIALDGRCTVENNEAIVTTVNAELSQVESFVRIANLERKFKFFEKEGVWTAIRLMKITTRTVNIMDLGDDK